MDHNVIDAVAEHIMSLLQEVDGGEIYHSLVRESLLDLQIGMASLSEAELEGIREEVLRRLTDELTKR